MTQIQSKDDILQALQSASKQVAQAANQVSDAQFFEATDDGWSAGGYLQHLILSVKPVAKAMEIPKDKFAKMFGTTENGSVTYVELVARYTEKLQRGLKAESTPTTPDSYRFPDDVDDKKAYLIETWGKANERLLAAIDLWSEEELDTYVLPHPAMPKTTLREMLFFTIHHNEGHAQDIAAVVEIS